MGRSGEGGDAVTGLAVGTAHITGLSARLRPPPAPSCPPAPRAEAVKFRRDSWQTWENYAQVAATIRQWQPAVRALQQVLALSQGQRLDLGVVAALVAHVEQGRGVGGNDGGGEGAGGGSDAALAAEGSSAPAEVDGGEAEQALAAALGELSTVAAVGTGGGLDAAATVAQQQQQQELHKPPQEEVERADERSRGVLEQAVGGLLKQAAATINGDSEFWGLYARWVAGEEGMQTCMPTGLLSHLHIGNCTTLLCRTSPPCRRYQAALGFAEAARECLLKRVRALGGAHAWQASEAGFEAYAQASLALCEAYLQVGALQCSAVPTGVCAVGTVVLPWLEKQRTCRPPPPLSLSSPLFHGV